MPINKGLASFDDASQQKHKYESLGQQLLKQRRDALETQLESFQSALITFKQQYDKELSSNPQIRTQFNQICRSFGVDPLVASSSIHGSKMEEEEKYNQLALKIIEICKITKKLNGGIILVHDVMTLINTDTSFMNDLKVTITEKDVMKTLDRLQSLGNELQLLVIGNKNYVKSIAEDLNPDQNVILSTTDVIGYVTVKILRDNFQWTVIRCRSNLDDLVSNGMLWLDTQAEDGEKKYWIAASIGED